MKKISVLLLFVVINELKSQEKEHFIREEKILQKLKSELSLDDSQYEKLKEINLEMDNDIRIFEEKIREERKVIFDKRLSKYKEVMSEEQYQNFLKISLREHDINKRKYKKNRR